MYCCSERGNMKEMVQYHKAKREGGQQRAYICTRSLGPYTSLGPASCWTTPTIGGMAVAMRSSVPKRMKLREAMAI